MTVDRPFWLALLFGPLGLFDAGRRHAALAVALIMALLALGVTWLVYLDLYLALDGGGGTAQEATQASIQATEALLRTAPQWAPQAAWVVVLPNVLSAGWLALRGAPPHPPRPTGTDGGAPGGGP